MTGRTLKETVFFTGLKLFLHRAETIDTEVVMTAEKDIVLIYQDDQPMIFARVEDIRPDVKKDWFQIRLMLLNLPVQTVTWILRDTYINGSEFTMGGQKMRLEKIEPPKEPGSHEDGPEDKSPKTDSKETGTVISLKDRLPK